MIWVDLHSKEMCRVVCMLVMGHLWGRDLGYCGIELAGRILTLNSFVLFEFESYDSNDRRITYLLNE